MQNQFELISHCFKRQETSPTNFLHFEEQVLKQDSRNVIESMFEARHQNVLRTF